MKKFLLLVLVFSALFVKSAFGATYPPPTGFVNDFAAVLTSDQKQALEANLSSFEKQTGSEISVAIIKTLNGEDVNDYAVRLFEQWKIGKKGQDNGLLLLIAMDERKVKIEIGYGLEPKLTDSQAGEIIRNTITPEFKKGNYYQGINAGIVAIEDRITQEPSNQKANSNLLNSVIGLAIGLGIFGWLFLPVIIYSAAFLGRSKKIWPGGAAGAILGIILGAIISPLLAILILGLVLGLFGLFLDWVLSRNYERLKLLGKQTGWRHTWGGFWAGGGSGSAGFGGFGGGSSGGGGASGSW